MHKRNKPKNQWFSFGFTMIELLVVVSIIGLLASVALVALKTARERALMVRIAADAHQIQSQIELTRDTKGKVLGEIIGNWCRACEFNLIAPVKNQPIPVAHNDADWVELGFPGGAPRDAWGTPYLLDANEGEPNYPCGRQDGVMSAGPNGIYEIQPVYFAIIPNPNQVYSVPGYDDLIFFMTLFKCLNPEIPG